MQLPGPLVAAHAHWQLSTHCGHWVALYPVQSKCRNSLKSAMRGIGMTYRHLRTRLQAIVDAAFDELDSRFGGHPETALERLPDPINSEEHLPYVEYMFGAMGVRGVAASTSKVLRSLDRDRSNITEGSSAE